MVSLSMLDADDARNNLQPELPLIANSFYIFKYFVDFWLIFPATARAPPKFLFFAEIVYRINLSPKKNSPEKISRKNPPEN